MSELKETNFNDDSAISLFDVGSVIFNHHLAILSLSPSQSGIFLLLTESSVETGEPHHLEM